MKLRGRARLLPTSGNFPALPSTAGSFPAQRRSRSLVVPLDVDGADLSRCFSNASLMRFLSISTGPIPALKGHRPPSARDTSSLCRLETPGLAGRRWRARVCSGCAGGRSRWVTRRGADREGEPAGVREVGGWMLKFGTTGRGFPQNRTPHLYRYFTGFYLSALSALGLRDGPQYLSMSWAKTHFLSWKSIIVTCNPSQNYRSDESIY
jgi:hypothetical protein